mmetsp:Transcript_9253/g.16666  ORF Transcript_9253/g.16666 Transcript_9253/m.16666 type:complete len:208 (-) Transcript_9253:1004-1627(-)
MEGVFNMDIESKSESDQEFEQGIDFGNEKIWHDISDDDLMLLHGELSDCGGSNHNVNMSEVTEPSSSGKSIEKNANSSGNMQKSGESIESEDGKRASRRMFRSLSGRPECVIDFYEPQNCVECRFGDMRRTWTFLDLRGYSHTLIRKSSTSTLPLSNNLHSKLDSVTMNDDNGEQDSSAAVRRTQSCMENDRNRDTTRRPRCNHGFK